MSILLTSILLSVGLGLSFAIFLVIAYKKLAVHEDPRVELIIEVLPGANCGACGYPGCAGYAEVLAHGKETNIAKCAPGGQEVANKIAHILGLDAVSVERKVAKLMCRGSVENAARRASYNGINSCRVADFTLKGDKGCVYGCLGFGDCVEACKFGAMFMGDDGLPHIIEEKCTACGKCVEACPRGLLELVSVERKVFVFCKSLDRGPVAKSYCKVACIGCGLCVKAAPEGSMKLENNLAIIINPKEVDVKAEEVVKPCPTGAITIDEKFAKVIST
ncbi:MAG: RnfABCDGE type electron transport complex subunit B [candidate division WOR-3 bacterium]